MFHSPFGLPLYGSLVDGESCAAWYNTSSRWFATTPKILTSAPTDVKDELTKVRFHSIKTVKVAAAR